jgi:uncharacterized protein (DUF2249 family)
MSKIIVTLDVRDDIQRGHEPFSRIMQAVASLKENQELLLIAPFKPAPLFGVLGQQGFSHEARPNENGDWEVRFFRGEKIRGALTQTGASSQRVRTPKREECATTRVVEVDARGLEPPQPLVKILEALAVLPAGAQLRAHTDRRPMHLYSQLEERGFVGETKEQKDGSFVTYVCQS